MNGPESRALRTSLHLERRHLTRLVKAFDILGGRLCQNDDINGWEASAGYPRDLLALLTIMDAAVTQLARRLYEGGRRSDGGCRIERPSVDKIVEGLALEDFGLVLGPAGEAALMGDQGDAWQRLFDAVVVRIAEHCAREGATLAIARPPARA